MTLAIKLSVIVAQRGPVGARRDHGSFASRSQRPEDAFIGVEMHPAFAGAGFVGDQCIGSIVGSRRSAPTRSCASPLVRKKPSGLPSASTSVRILVLSPPRERPIAWSSPAFFGRRCYADGRAQWCC